ncbi:antitoxin Xre/MbcA/ParS toxin-binding domain-containing protein [Flavobacterium sp. W21_SRS_FM6]|uniref:antitoxin Xre/MbcA/ParS toxin-binding domain-containing protein n=1 Tax=Flavobacterium sp. W21_SRS_FM6 TaxID=3240268 RepID=UPI003F930746
MSQFQTVQPLDKLLISRFEGENEPDLFIAMSDLVFMMSEGASGAILKSICKNVPKSIIIKTVGSDNANFSKLFRRKLSKKQTDDVYDLSTLWVELRRFFNNDSDMIAEWLNTPIPALENNKPEDLLDTSFGRHQVKLCLETMKFCDFA